MVGGPPYPSFVSIINVYCVPFSLLFTQLIFSAFSLTLSHFCTSFLLFLLSPSYMLSFTWISTVNVTSILFKQFKVTVSRNYFAVLLENFAEISVLPLFFAGVQSVARTIWFPVLRMKIPDWILHQMWGLFGRCACNASRGIILVLLILGYFSDAQEHIRWKLLFTTDLYILLTITKQDKNTGTSISHINEWCQEIQMFSLNSIFHSWLVSVN